MDYKREIINKINGISGKYSAYEVFTDWVHCCSLAVSNGSAQKHDPVWEKREKEYFNVVRKYKNDEVKMFSDMLGMLNLALEERQEDVLGWIYMDTRMGSREAGQIITLMFFVVV